MAITRKFNSYSSDSHVHSSSHPSNKFFRVNQSLAMTPAKMKELTDKGIAISSQSLEYMEGSDNPPNEVELLQRRGIDVIDAWEAEQDAKQKFNKLRESSQSETPINV